MSTVDVIVIGAGLAGLSAARRLKERGASVIVLEARPRIGGRVQTERLPTGHVVDHGAQFLSDDHKRLSALVDEVGLTRVARGTTGQYAYFSSPTARPALAEDGQLPLSLWARLDGLQLYWRIGRHQKCVRQADRASWDTRTAAAYIRELAFTDEAYRFLAGFLEGELCIPMDALSACELIEQASSVGGRQGEADSAQWFLAEGTGPLADHLAGILGASVVLNAPVKRVHHDADGVTVETVHTTYRARHLIVTAPPQLYGALGILPHLPENRQRVIARYQPGSVIKTVLVFEQPWWHEQGLPGSLLSPGAICSAGLDASPPDGRTGTLVLFSTSASGRCLGQTTHEPDRIEKVLEWLRSLAGPNVPAPIAARSVDWNADPWSLGGYASRRGLGGWTEAPGLFAPVGNIHFAGTETATEWRSFMEGALQSAERAVDALLVAR